MAYIVGILSEAEQVELERRGWEVEPAPAELIPPLAGAPVGDTPPERYKMVFVDASMFEVMDGPDWDKTHVMDKGEATVPIVGDPNSIDIFIDIFSGKSEKDLP